MRLSKYLYITALISLMMGSAEKASAERTFVHPGISYTQADIDRMKAMIAAKQEPFYSTFMMLKTSSYSSTSGTASDRGAQITEGKFNGTIGADGRRAHDLALLYVLTGEKKYGDKAVQYLNANSHYTNTSSRGTGPLDNGKINLLIEAAELMRDYAGWKAEDQQRFKDMLVYPGFSTEENFYDKYASLDDSKNGITFYWNIYNFDAGRFGNQGMFAARGLLAMGVYLDNDVMFDRAYQYLNGTQDVHFDNYADLGYAPGPRTPKSSITAKEFMAEASGTNNYQTVANYGYDEQLQYYIYANGQCQESSRDQGHTMCGVMMYVNMAEICWNQGEDLYGALDNRILKGIEYNTRVNMTCLTDYDKYLSDKDWAGPWAPSSYSVTGTKPSADWKPATSYKDANEPTDPEVYYQAWSRSARWFSKSLATDGGDKLGSSGCREMAYAHYHGRMGMPESAMPWLTRDRQYLLKKYRYENWGMDAGHHYEWCGWGTLSKTRPEWMPGDGVSFKDGQRVSGLHAADEEVLCADFDYFAADGNGHTYFKHDTKAKIDHTYRPDGHVEIAESNGQMMVKNMTDGEWLTYSYAISTAADYNIRLTYAVMAGSPKIELYIDDQLAGEIQTETTYGTLTADKWAMQNIQLGAHVLKIKVVGEDAKVDFGTLTVTTKDVETAIAATPEAKGGRYAAYNLQGMRVTSTDSRGLYLVNGRKYLYK